MLAKVKLGGVSPEVGRAGHARQAGQAGQAGQVGPARQIRSAIWTSQTSLYTWKLCRLVDWFS